MNYIYNSFIPGAVYLTPEKKQQVCVRVKKTRFFPKKPGFFQKNRFFPKKNPNQWVLLGFPSSTYV